MKVKGKIAPEYLWSGKTNFIEGVRKTKFFKELIKLNIKKVLHTKNHLIDSHIMNFIFLGLQA